MFWIKRFDSNLNESYWTVFKLNGATCINRYLPLKYIKIDSTCLYFCSTHWNVLTKCISLFIRLSVLKCQIGNTTGDLPVGYCIGLTLSFIIKTTHSYTVTFNGSVNKIHSHLCRMLLNVLDVNKRTQSIHSYK